MQLAVLCLRVRGRNKATDSRGHRQPATAAGRTAADQGSEEKEVEKSGMSPVSKTKTKRHSKRQRIENRLKRCKLVVLAKLGDREYEGLNAIMLGAARAGVEAEKRIAANQARRARQRY